MKTQRKLPTSIFYLTGMLMYGMLSISAMAGVNNFSGTWLLNKEKSELGERNRADLKREITQTETELIVKSTYTGREGNEMTREDKYKLDGSESINDGLRNSQRKSKVHWNEDGKLLTIKSTMEFERNGEKQIRDTTETWSVSDDGKTLTVVASSDRGTTTMIYNKQ